MQPPKLSGRFCLYEIIVYHLNIDRNNIYFIYLFILHFHHFAIYFSFLPSIFKENNEIVIKTICLLKH